MAYQGRKVWSAGDILTASDMNSTVDQSVMVFADATARNTAIPSPTEGMVVWLESTNLLYVYNGSAWVKPSAADADTATNIAGGSEMAIVYQSASGTTATLAAGTAGYVLQTNGTGSAPTWVATSGVAGDSDQVVLSGRIFG